MTPQERNHLIRLVRQREALAKADAKARAARLKADAEAQLGTIFKVEDSAWADITAKASEIVRAATKELHERCRALEIPKQMWPYLSLGWSGRYGEYSDRQRRAEIKAMTVSRINDLQQAARAEIERRSLETQTVLLEGSLETEEARQFLASMPTAEQLMPALDMTALELVMPGLTNGRLLSSLAVALAPVGTAAALADGTPSNDAAEVAG